MNAMDAVPTGSLVARFRQAIKAWCSRNGVSAGALGAAALRDQDFVPSLRGGRNPRLRRADSVPAVMGEPLAGPAFLREVEASLAVTGVKRSMLGSGATGNRSFVAQLRNGLLTHSYQSPPDVVPALRWSSQLRKSRMQVLGRSCRHRKVNIGNGNTVE